MLAVAMIPSSWHGGGLRRGIVGARWPDHRLLNLQPCVRRRIEASLAILLEAAAQQAANGGGRRWRSVFHSGSVFSTAASVSETVAPSNRRFPVSISQSTTPKAQRSARLSTVVPRACSGLM